MTTLAKHHSNDTTKMLLVGASGTGKTGATAALAKDYRMFYIDLDNGLDMLKAALVKTAPERMATDIFYKNFNEDIDWTGAGLNPKSARAFQEAMKSIHKWVEDDGKDMGGIRSWGPDTILVVDGLSRLSKNAMNLILSLNNRIATGPIQSDWYDAQNEVENFLAMITAPSVKCNVILIAHVALMDDPVNVGSQKGVPMTYVGQKLAPRIAGYFNTMLLAKSLGTGTQARRVIRTTPDGSIEVKYPALPGALPPELPIDSGLATFFRKMRDLSKSPTTATTN